MRKTRHNWQKLMTSLSARFVAASCLNNPAMLATMAASNSALTELKEFHYG